MATYNRAEVLRRAIRCARAQTTPDWAMLVIGDACGAETGEMLAGFDDHRIRFINLPRRFGEQAGPNSIGMLLAETPYVALLNHDDLWLPNHLSDALRHLESSDADIYWSRAAFFTNRGPRSDLGLFREASPIGRTLDGVYDAPTYYAEPVSSWVLTNSVIRSLGPMSLASQTPIVPVQEYMIRAWRQGASLAAGEAITVLKDHMAPVPQRGETQPPRYDADNEYAESWVRKIEANEVDLLRDAIEDDLWLADQLSMARRFGTDDRMSRRAASDAFVHAGIDLVRYRAEASSTNFMGRFDRVLRNRTGEQLSEQPDLEEMMGFARSCLEGPT